MRLIFQSKTPTGKEARKLYLKEAIYMTELEESWQFL